MDFFFYQEISTEYGVCMYMCMYTCCAQHQSSFISWHDIISHSLFFLFLPLVRGCDGWMLVQEMGETWQKRWNWIKSLSTDSINKFTTSQLAKWAAWMDHHRRPYFLLFHPHLIINPILDDSGHEIKFSSSSDELKLSRSAPLNWIIYVSREIQCI